ncbi:hypothetical protein L2744_16565 [Shewanella profunda]|uniref:hypothetical protein n=1 Tax=Shewanella profunda TaxID=254793 RepID=UPI0020102453|nr:hypothetical protein [Shewanella profunda]MCL1091185.1 hypothetical protein [Shewanella profunda]
MKKKLSIVLLSILLTACAGGTIGGLLPAPKILDGKLDGRKYSSPDSVLKVVAPASEERGEWTYTVVKEHSEQHPDQNSRLVSFKTPYDSHFYSVEIVQLLNKRTLNDEMFSLVKSDNLSRVISSTEERWGSKAEKLFESVLNCENKKSYSYLVYKQRITSYTPNFYKYFLISQSYEGNTIAVVTSELNFDLRNTNIPEEEIKNLNYRRHNEFACSVEFSG